MPEMACIVDETGALVFPETGNCYRVKQRNRGQCTVILKNGDGKEIHRARINPDNDRDRDRFVKGLNGQADVVRTELHCLAQKLDDLDDTGPEEAGGSEGSVAPEVELLDDAPLTLARPLDLIDGRAYAATWLWVRVTQHTSTDPDTGEVFHHDPPIVKTERRPFIVRDDGTVFGDGAAPIAELGFVVRLDSEPEDRHVWRTPGLKRYRANDRPNPADVFRKVAGAYDHFLDFSHSLGDQAAMCDLSACFSLATWLASAFTVLGYPYPNGEFGSGKTKHLSVWVETSYLGYLLTLGGTFAAMRDLADYGATLAFDDAENLDDPKADPDKKALLLAGNRRGARIPLKELEPNGKRWRIRWVNAFCPRGFSAKKPPMGALATRSVLIPLVRTGNPTKANRDPADLGRWPIDLGDLRDDLWAVALMVLPKAAAVWAELDNETELVGRTFEPWRALLAVARLFERHGVAGLEETVRSVMRRAIKEASDGVRVDLTSLVLRGLCRYAVNAVGAVWYEGSQELDAIKTAQIVELARGIATDLETDINADTIESRRVGRVMGALRFKKARDAKLKGWEIDTQTLATAARAYNVPFVESTSDPPLSNGIDGTNGITAQPPPEGPEPGETAHQATFEEDTSDTAHPCDDDPEPFVSGRRCVHCGADLPIGWTDLYCRLHGGSESEADTPEPTSPPKPVKPTDDPRFAARLAEVRAMDEEAFARFTDKVAWQNVHHRDADGFAVDEAVYFLVSKERREVRT